MTGNAENSALPLQE